MTRRFLVSGRVQGVAYRAHTRREAERLGLTGHAKNLPDGRVEVIAHGEESALLALESWLWRGPLLARVDAVVVDEVPAPVASKAFAIL